MYIYLYMDLIYILLECYGCPFLFSFHPYLIKVKKSKSEVRVYHKRALPLIWATLSFDEWPIISAQPTDGMQENRSYERH